MTIGFDWFTKSMLINTLSRNQNVPTQQVTPTTDFSELFGALLNQFLMQTDSLSTLPSNLSSITNDGIMEKIAAANIEPKMVYENITLNENETLGFQSINAEKLNQELEGKLKGMGDIFIRAGRQYNVNPALLAAISQHETGNGKSHAAINKNNIAGMMGVNGLKSYSSVEDSIQDMARNISKNYLGLGLTSISEIGHKYAPVGADNDPTGLNNHWVTGVTKYFNNLKV